MTRLLLVLALLGGPALAEDGPGPIRRFALVVGANNGGAERVMLRYAQSDAQSFLDVVTDLGGVAQSDAILLREPDPQALQTALDDLADMVSTAGETRTEVLFYYSGHSDEQGLLLRGKRYEYRDVRADLDAVDADVRIAVVDSCASGALVRTKGGTLAPPFLVDESSMVSGHAYLTSASADEAAQEADRILGSYFTHALVTGLRGAADATGDGRVTLSEAYAFAYDETLSRTEKTRFGAQHATRDIHLSGTGDLVLTDLSAVDAGIVLDPDLSGRLSVRDGQGRLVAEVFKPAGRPMELGLGSGRYRLHLDREDAAYETKLWLAKGQHTQLSLAAFTRIERVASVARGDAPDRSGLTWKPAVFALAPVKPVNGGGRDVGTHAAMSLGGAHVAALKGTAISFGGTVVQGDGNGLLLGMVGNGIGGNQRGTAMSMGLNVAEGDVTGGQWSIGTNLAGGNVKGVQATVGANLAGRDVKGAQLSVGLNAAGERFRGAQISVGANLAGRDMVGTQMSVGSNVAVGAVQGFQGSVGANIAVGPMRGVQAAAGVNIAAPTSRGLQLSSGVNIAGNDFGGAQIGVINIGADVRGTQVGVINIGRRVRGTQVGVVNVAKSVSGVPAGVLNIVEEGQFHGEAWSSDTLPMNVGVQFGAKRAFSQLHLGYDPRTGLASTGFGLGVHMQRFADPEVEDDRDGRLWGEVDVTGGNLWKRQGNSIDLANSDTFLGTVRGSVGYELGKHLSPEIGVQLSVLVDADSNGTDVRPLALPGGVQEGAVVAVWPGVFAGVQF